jgi:hypothetical protein
MCLVNHSQELKTRHNKVTNSLFNHIVTCKAILNYSEDVAISVSDKANWKGIIKDGIKKQILCYGVHTGHMFELKLVEKKTCKLYNEQAKVFEI